MSTARGLVVAVAVALVLVACGGDDADEPRVGVEAGRSTTTSAAADPPDPGSLDPDVGTATTATSTVSTTAPGASGDADGPPPTTAATTSTTTTTVPPATTGRVEGSVVVDEDDALVRVELTRDDAVVAAYEARTSSSFAFPDLPPATYVLELYEESEVYTAPDGSQGSASRLTRSDAFEVAAGEVVQVRCDDECVVA